MSTSTSKAVLRSAILTLIVALEVVFFPAIAGVLVQAAGSRGGVGSEIMTFRDLYVVPGAALFIVTAWAVLARAGQRRFVFAAVCLASAIILILATVAYRAMVSRWD